jgi:hypothetical protein
MKQESTTKLTAVHKSALVDQRNHLIMVCLEQGYTPAEISFLFNISKQLVNSIKQKQNGNRRF